MRAILDTDVVLDLLLEREPFVHDAFALWKANEEGLFEGYVSAITPVNIFYIARKIKGRSAAHQLVGELLAGIGVCPIDETILQLAHTSAIPAYEDAVQHASAAAMQLDALVTRNTKDYAESTLRVFTPADFLAHLAAQRDV